MYSIAIVITWHFNTKTAITITKKPIIDCNQLPLLITITPYLFPTWRSIRIYHYLLKLNLQYGAGRSWSKIRLTNMVLPAKMSSLQVALSDGRLAPCLGVTLNSQNGRYKKRSPWGLGKILEDSICNTTVTYIITR